MKIFHLLPLEDWEEQDLSQDYGTLLFEKNGFLPCCKADQIIETAERILGKFDKLALLKINSEKLKFEVEMTPPYEFPQSKVLYPHLKGPLNHDAIEKVFTLKKNANGHFVLPSDLLN